MKNSIEVLERTSCAACEGTYLEALRVIDNFPVLPICTDQDSQNDLLAPLDVRCCNECGLVQLRKLMPPEFIYSMPHSEGIGETWTRHYKSFEKFILTQGFKHDTSRVMEPGAGNGQIAE